MNVQTTVLVLPFGIFVGVVTCLKREDAVSPPPLVICDLTVNINKAPSQSLTLSHNITEKLYY